MRRNTKKLMNDVQGWNSSIKHVKGGFKLDEKRRRTILGCIDGRKVHFKIQFSEISTMQDPLYFHCKPWRCPRVPEAPIGWTLPVGTTCFALMKLVLMIAKKVDRLGDGEARYQALEIYL